MGTQVPVLEASHGDSRFEGKKLPAPHDVRKTPRILRAHRARRWGAFLPICISGTILVFGVLASSPSAYGAEATVGLGTATAYSVLGGQAVTNTGPSTLSGDLG